MSGPIDVEDAATGDGGTCAPASRAVDVVPSRRAQVGSVQVRRALPTRGRRTVGAWCFADHFGPVPATPGHGIDIGPHPHMGLQTVTWLLAGEVLHRDSLGSEQLIRPGQLNLMTAGHGVAHAEEASRYRGELHGVQLWVAQPSASRDGAPAFEHHAELPSAELGAGEATVLVGELAGSASPTRRDTDHVGADVSLRRGTTATPVDPGHEFALVVTEGQVSVEGHEVGPGQLAYLGQGRDELVLTATGPSRLLLLGGTPFPEPLTMWWNFVGRTRDEMLAAQRDWATDSGRFGRVASSLARIEVDPPPWTARPG